MLEQRPWREAFGRSAELVRGHFRHDARPRARHLRGERRRARPARWPPSAGCPSPDALSGWVVGVTADSLAFPYFALIFNAAYARLTTHAAEGRAPAPPAPAAA